MCPPLLPITDTTNRNRCYENDPVAPEVPLRHPRHRPSCFLANGHASLCSLLKHLWRTVTPAVTGHGAAATRNQDPEPRPGATMRAAYYCKWAMRPPARCPGRVPRRFLRPVTALCLTRYHDPLSLLTR